MRTTTSSGNFCGTGLADTFGYLFRGEFFTDTACNRAGFQQYPAFSADSCATAGGIDVEACLSGCPDNGGAILNFGGLPEGRNSIRC